MGRGGVDGYLSQLKKSVRSLEECRVVADEEGEWYALEDGLAEVHLEVTPSGELCWADLSLAVAGQGGGLVRLPKPGDTGLVAFVGGDKNRAHLLGWTATSSAMAAAQELEEDLYLLRARDGESILVRATGAGSVKLEAGGVALELTSGGEVLLGSDGVDVLAVLSDALDALSSTTVATSLGPQPLSSAATLATLKGKIDTIKGA